MGLIGEAGKTPYWQMKHWDTFSWLSLTGPPGRVTALRSQFLSGHPSTCTKRFHFYCDGIKFLLRFYVFAFIYLYFLGEMTACHPFDALAVYANIHML